MEYLFISRMKLNNSEITEGQFFSITILALTKNLLNVSHNLDLREKLHLVSVSDRV